MITQTYLHTYTHISSGKDVNESKIVPRQQSLRYFDPFEDGESVCPECVYVEFAHQSYCRKVPTGCTTPLV